MLHAAPDLQPPVGYDDRWVVLAVVSVTLVAAYYAVVWWATRSRIHAPRATRTGPRWRARARRRSRPDAAAAQRCLTAISEIESAVAQGRLRAREAHQRLSVVIRAFVEESGSVPAASMTLAALRATGPAPVADLVAVLYPPEFEPAEPGPDQLGPVLHRARTLVTTWR